MRHTLHSHIIYLENKIQALRDRLTRRHVSPAELHDLEQQISLAELALERYREAYLLELSISNPEPPDSSGANPDRGAEPHGDASSEGKKKGRAAIVARTKERTRERRLPSIAAAGAKGDGRARSGTTARWGTSRAA